MTIRSAAMSNLQLIEELCQLVEQMSGVIRTLASELEQCHAFSDVERNAVAEVRMKYSEILGAEEFPDSLDDILE